MDQTCSTAPGSARDSSVWCCLIDHMGFPIMVSSLEFLCCTTNEILPLVYEFRAHVITNDLEKTFSSNKAAEITAHTTSFCYNLACCISRDADRGDAYSNCNDL